MEIIDGKICISHEELTGRVITTANLKNLVYRGKVRQVQKGGNGRQAFYEVESFALKWRTEIYKRWPDLKEQADSKEFIDTVIPDGKGLLYFENYKLEDGRNLPSDKIVEYAGNAAIMNAFLHCWEAHVNKRQRTGKKTVAAKEFWTRAAAALPRLADRIPHSLPGNPRRLQMKMAEYVRDGYECFISRKFQNGNAAKIEDEDREAVITSLLSHHNNLPDTKIASSYNRFARLNGWRGISPASVGVWRKKLAPVINAGRLGLSNFRNNVTMQVKRSRPTTPLLMWSLDGWTVELLYQTTRTDKKGHNVTTYTNRLTMVVVLDVFNNYPIGYAVGTHESPALIKEALRDAAKHTQALFGEMLRANQIQSDRYQIKTMHDLYAVMGENVTPAQAHNAKSKPVEPYFKYLNINYCIMCNNWSGFGITTNPKRQPNSDALNRMRHHFPDEAGVRAQIDEMMRLERMGKYEAYMSGYSKLKSEHRLPLSRETYLLNYGLETGFKNVLEGCGLRPTILGMKRDYDCFDLSFRDHAAERWIVRFDPDDLSHVLAVSEDGMRRYMLEEKYVQPMALADRKDEDAEQLERVRDYNRRLEAQTAERMAQAYHRTGEIIARTPTLRGSIEDRLLITDSQGQHKDNRSRKRLTASDIDALEVKAVEVPIIQAGQNQSDAEAYETNDFSIF